MGNHCLLLAQRSLFVYAESAGCTAHHAVDFFLAACARYENALALLSDCQYAAHYRECGNQGIEPHAGHFATDYWHVLVASRSRTILHDHSPFPHCGTGYGTCDLCADAGAQCADLWLFILPIARVVRGLAAVDAQH